LLGARIRCGGYLRTADDAPLKELTFRGGYTIEAFVKLADEGRVTRRRVCSRGWYGARRAKDRERSGRAGGQARFSGGLQVQWAVYPLDQNDTFTSWGHEQRVGQWFHLAIVNDGRQSIVYVDSSELLRNPVTPSNGLATAGKPCLVGTGHYVNTIDQGFAGHIGEVRIVKRGVEAGAVPNRLTCDLWGLRTRYALSGVPVSCPRSPCLVRGTEYCPRSPCVVRSP
jgi:hypothetical protein